MDKVSNAVIKYGRSDRSFISLGESTIIEDVLSLCISICGSFSSNYQRISKRKSFLINICWKVYKYLDYFFEHFCVKWSTILSEILLDRSPRLSNASRSPRVMWVGCDSNIDIVMRVMLIYL